MRTPMTRASRYRARAHPGFGFVSTDGFAWQDKKTARTARQGKARVRAHRGHAVEAPGERYLARRASVLRASGCRSCLLFPSSIDYAC